MKRKKTKKAPKKPKKVIKNPKVPRTRCSGTMTESQFWSMIRSTLRRKSMSWKPIQDIKEEHRRENQSSNKKLKWEYQCNRCKQWFPEKITKKKKSEILIEVDHIVPAGSCNEETVGQFIQGLFCEKHNLQLLCYQCHAEKTKESK